MNFDWYGCYSEGWQNEIVPEAFSHPAKFSRALIRRIYAHALERGYLKPGDWVADCFAGVGLGAADALALGLNWFGNELEQNFVDLGAGCDCTGISKDDWVACFGRWKRFAHRDGRHWCPRCLAEAGQIIKERKAPEPNQAQAKRRARMRELMAQTGRKVGFSLYVPIPFPESRKRQTVRAARLFGTEALATSYKRNSGKIPHTGPHRYTGNLNLFARHARDGATAVLVQGDSRRLVEVLEGARAEGLISSPPFSSTLGKGGETKGFHSYDEDEAYNRCKRDYVVPDAGGQLGNMPTGEPPQCILSSPPYATQTVHDRCGVDPDKLTGNPPGPHSQALTMANYGDSDGQLAAMREGDVDAVIASPPWTSTSACEDPNYRTDRQAPGGPLYNDYGNSDGQLAALREGEPPQVDGLVSSPPYWDSEMGGHGGEGPNTKWRDGSFKGDEEIQKRDLGKGYGQTEGQLCDLKQDTFWSASRAILLQCHTVLAPSGVAIWVLKAFVRNKAIVDFPGQWEALCNSCGFETVEVIRTHLVEDRGEQFALNGDLVKRKVRRFSFFRRLHMKKYPHLAINWEIVLITRKGVA